MCTRRCDIVPITPNRRQPKQTHTGVIRISGLFFEVQIPTACDRSLSRTPRKPIFNFKHWVLNSGCDMVTSKPSVQSTAQIIAPFCSIHDIIVTVNQYRRGCVSIGAAIFGGYVENSAREKAYI